MCSPIEARSSPRILFPGVPGLGFFPAARVGDSVRTGSPGGRGPRAGARRGPAQILNV